MIYVNKRIKCISFNLNRSHMLFAILICFLLIHIAEEVMKINDYVDKKYYLLFRCVLYMRTKHVSDNYRNEQQFNLAFFTSLII